MSSMSSKPPRYRSYLLRCWAEAEAEAELRRRADDPATWRFSLEDPHTGERHAFADLERLTAFVLERIAEDEHEQPRDRAGPAAERGE